MTNRVGKQIKLTDIEYQAFTSLSDDRGFPSAKQFLDDLLERFISTNEDKDTHDLTILAPSKAGIYRTLWMATEIGKAVKSFADKVNASQNAIIYTAVKSLLNDQGAVVDA